MPFSATLLPSAVSEDEIGRQFSVLWQERYQRIALTMLAFALTAIYLPLWLSALCAAVLLTAEGVCLRLMRDLDPTSQKGRYRVTLASVFVMEFAYAFAAGQVWMIEDPFSKAFALGMVMVTVLHLTTVRSIHLPYGIAGFAAVCLAILLANSAYWLDRGDLLGWAVSTLCACGGLGYSATAMWSNNSLHRAMAANSRAAQDANDAKGRFLTQMSHELRTPLNAIIGLGHAERDRAADPVSRQRLETLVSSAQSLAIILDDILDLSAISEGRLTLRPDPFSPQEAVLATAALFDLQAAAVNIRLVVDGVDTLPRRILQDPQRFRQCLTNLVSNALRHSGASTVTLRAKHTPGTLLIDVIDDGRGLSDAARAAFVSAVPASRDPVLARRHGGMGLAISRALARQMGGDLMLIPSEKGARFCLVIAFAEPHPDDASTPAPRGGQVSDLLPDLSGLTVLVVDDIATNRMVAASYLTIARARVIEVSGGHDALQVLAQGGVDLVLLDMNMPGMSGIETLQALRALPAPVARVPVLAMTADAMQAQRDQYLRAGLDDHVPKPLTPESLGAALRRHVRKPTA